MDRILFHTSFDGVFNDNVEVELSPTIGFSWDNNVSTFCSIILSED